jgi:two-component system, OmpR family, phosphate regulon sensor histidine kinase PhoR
MRENTPEILAEAVFESVFLLDANDTILFVNDAVLTLLSGHASRERESVLGKSILEVTHLRSLKELVGMARVSNSPCEREVRLTLQGPERVLLARATPATSSQVFLTLLDRTELLHLRTVRTEFVANASHELRTPLATIQAMAETLQDGALGDPNAAQRFLGSILSQTHRMRRLVEDLLILTRAESEERNQVRLSLQEVLRESLESEQTHAQGRQVVLGLTMPDTPIRIIADRLEMDQVFVNLIDNGVKYTPSGGSVTVTLSEATRPDGTKEAMICVTDTGIGILSEDISRIFERFWRADQARQFQKNEGIGQTGGTGLGLSIVKHIIEAHGGRILVQSELGRGTTITVCLPIVSTNQ